MTVPALPGDFLGPALVATPERYVHVLAPEVRRELAGLLGRIARGDVGAEIEGAVQGALGEATRRAGVALGAGPGVMLIRGVPVEGHERGALATLFSMMGRALGRPMPQNLERETMVDVRDTGADPADPDVRLYRTRAEQDFHTDGAEVIGLLCADGSPRFPVDGGAS